MVTGNSAALTSAALAWLLLAAAPVQAQSSYVVDDPGGRYTAFAEVVQVSPRYDWQEVTEPVRRCVAASPYDHYRENRYRHYDDRRRHGDGDVAASLVGGLIGGLIGNQFGGGRGRTALTVAGAALGASVARDHVRRSHEHYHGSAYDRPVRQCSETWQTRRIRALDGYDVSYRYQGRTFHKWMEQHPGDTVPVQVAVEPWSDASP